MRFMMQSTILVKGERCDGASKIFEGFVSPISATVYERCIKADLSFVGFVSSCELGIDTLFDEDNELDGSVGAILGGSCDVVFCNDTFGRVARQAAERGLFFLQGAYGRVSRYGVISLVSSMDRVGVLCRNIEDAVKVLNIISGGDGKDAVCSEYKYLSVSEKKAEPFVCSPAELKYADILPTVFYILSSAEVCNNISRYDGVKYGYRSQNANNLEELYLRSRSEGLGKDMKLLSVVGCMVLEKDNYERLYYKSMQLRRLIRDYYSALLDKYGTVALPLNREIEDKFDSLALPSISALCGFASVYTVYNGEPCLLIAKSENALFSLFGEVSR